MSTRGSLMEILLHVYNLQQKEVIDYDVTTLKIIHPITFLNYTKYPMKVLRNKNNFM